MEEKIINETPEEVTSGTTEETEKKPKKTLKSEILDWAKTLLFYCVIPLLVFQAFCFMASVPTGSMETTIPVGSQVFTTRCFNKGGIERGDIVVFDSEELGVILIKRCIGEPGDKVVLDGTGDVYINGELLEEPYVSSYSGYSGEFEVPEDHYLFFGDNRGGSIDARYWENPYVHKDAIKGKARFVVFPFDNFGILE